MGCSSIAPSDLGRVGAKVLLFYLATSFCAILIGLGVGIFLEPGAGLGITGAASAQAKAANAPSMSQIFSKSFPD